jgi:xylose isomerase
MELVRALHRISYAGVLYFDTFPLNEDPVAEAERNARIYRDFYARFLDIELDVEDAIAHRDAVRALDAASM